MNHFFLSSVGIPVLFALLVRNADLSFGAALTKQIFRAILYGIAALLLFIALLLALGV